MAKQPQWQTVMCASTIKRQRGRNFQSPSFLCYAVQDSNPGNAATYTYQVALPTLANLLKTLSQTRPGACPTGDSESCPVGNISHHSPHEASESQQRYWKSGNAIRRGSAWLLRNLHESELSDVPETEAATSFSLPRPRKCPSFCLPWS